VAPSRVSQLPRSEPWRPGVKVIIGSIETNLAQSIKTNNSGYYRVTDLVSGKYRVHFAAAGFIAEDITQIQVKAWEWGDKES
jgi:hypothetical protein